MGFGVWGCKVKSLGLKVGFRDYGLDVRVSGVYPSPGGGGEGSDCAGGGSCCTSMLFGPGHRKVAIRLHGKGNSNSHGATPVYYYIQMMWWIWTSRLSKNDSLSLVLYQGLRFRVHDLRCSVQVWGPGFRASGVEGSV